ncbi:MAG: hypothetical protein WBM41_08545 [Arenicellales bacterium]
MEFLRATLRRAIRLFAAKFFVVTGKEKGSDSLVSVLWSGTEQQLAYFQDRIFGCNSVTLTRVGRRPMVLTDRLMKRFDCSFCVIVVEQQFLSLVRRHGDFLLPLWVSCDVPLNDEREYAKSASIRDDIRHINDNKFTWKLSDKRDDFDYFFEKIYIPTITTSHGRSALTASYENRLHKFKSGTMELLQIMHEDKFLAGVAIDFDGDLPTLRDSGVLNGSPQIKKSGAISATYLFAMDYLASKGYSNVSFGLSRSFLDDGVLNYKRKFRPIITTGSNDSVLIRIRSLDEPTRSMLRDSPCITWQGQMLQRTYFRDPTEGLSERQSRKIRGKWRFGIDAESVFDVSGDALIELTTHSNRPTLCNQS